MGIYRNQRQYFKISCYVINIIRMHIARSLLTQKLSDDEWFFISTFFDVGDRVINK